MLWTPSHLPDAHSRLISDSAAGAYTPRARHPDQSIERRGRDAILRAHAPAVGPIDSAAGVRAVERADSREFLRSGIVAFSGYRCLLGSRFACCVSVECVQTRGDVALGLQAAFISFWWTVSRGETRTLMAESSF